MSRSPGANLNSSLAGHGAAGRPNAHAESGGSASAMRLEHGKAYEGVIVAAGQMEYAYDVKLASPKVVLPDCILGVGVISSLLGVSHKFKAVVGTSVLVTWMGRGVITAMLPSEVPDIQGAEARVLTTSPMLASELYSADETEGDIRPVNRGPTPEADMIEGEHDLTNALKVGITLLTHLAQLKAGDRAKVETHLLNDMVRIISERYEHLSAFGDFQIINDGGLQCIWHGTSYPFEALGVQKDKKWADATDNKVDFASAAETGRWRFSQYVGHIGNFISMFVTDPVDGLAELAQERAGKFHMHVNNDGSFLLRSVADIAIERVTRISVPIQKHRLDSPDGKKKADYLNTTTKALKQWKYADTDNRWHAAYQLRDYSRWLANHHAYARFLQSDDFEVKADSDGPVPSATNDEADVKAANGDVDLIDVYSCYRLMRDGSTVQLDGYGNCTVTSAFGVHIASASNLTFEAAGNIYLLAGNNIFMKARRSIEMLAQFGGVLMTAKTWLKALCEKGSVWLKSDASKTDAAAYTPKTDGDPQAEYADYAVVLDAPMGSAAMLAGGTVRISSDGTSEDEVPENGDHDTKKAVLIQAVPGPVSVRARKHIDVVATGDEEDANIRMKAGKGHLLIDVANSVMAKCEEMDVNQLLVLNKDRELQVLAEATRCKNLYAHKQLFNPSTKAGVPQHTNHTRVLPDDHPELEPVEDGKDELKELQQRSDIIKAYFGGAEPAMRAEQADVYTAGMPGDTYHPKSETQRIADEQDGYEDWNLAAPIRGTRTECDPFPGKTLKLAQCRPQDTTPLGDVSDKDPQTTPTSGTGLTSTGGYVLKRKKQ